VVCRIDPNLAEIKRARIDRARSRPMFAAVFRSKNASAFAAQIGQSPRTALITLDNCHHDLRAACAYGETDAPGLPGQATAQFFPGGTAICAFENSANI